MHKALAAASNAPAQTGFKQARLDVLDGFGDANLAGSNVHIKQTTRKLKREGRSLRDTLRSSTFQGRPVEISLMGGMASLKVGSPGAAPAVESPTANPARQLEDPASMKIRELSELARLLENDLITQDEFELAKHQLLNLHTIPNPN